jgi:hypothetical protein
MLMLQVALMLVGSPVIQSFFSVGAGAAGSYCSPIAT